MGSRVKSSFPCPSFDFPPPPESPIALESTPNGQNDSLDGLERVAMHHGQFTIQPKVYGEPHGEKSAKRSLVWGSFLQLVVGIRKGSLRQ